MRLRRASPSTASTAAGLALLGLASGSVPSCVAAPRGAPVALRDPYGLIDDVIDTGHALRLLVLPAASYACNADGTTVPAIVDPPAMFPEAIVDITLTADGATDSASGEADVPVGNWTILVQGDGTDPVSMVPNTLIATGCASVEMLGAGETREVSITLQRVSGMGMCGDSILSPDEQCEGPGTLDCSATCQTVAAPLNNQTTTGTQSSPRFGARTGRRVAAVFDSRPDGVLRLLDANGRNLTSPGALERDRTVDAILGDGGASALMGEQIAGNPAVASDGRIAIPLVDFAMPADTDVRLVLLDENRAVLGGGAIHVRTARTMSQRDPSVGFTGTGALMVVFEDLASATGLSATFFAAGSTTPMGEAVPVGGTGGTEPALAAHDAGFVIAYTAAGDVFFQRFGADGTATDAAGRPVLTTATGTQDQPTIAALANGTFAVAWREGDVGSGDGAGTSIRARVFAADGTARGEAFVVNSTTAGDQSSPAIAGADGRFTFAWQSGSELRGAFFGENGMRLLNRERPTNANDFVIGVGNPTNPLVSVAAVGSGADAAWVFGWSDPGTDVLFRRYAR